MCLSIFSFHYPPMHTFFNAVKGKYLDRCKIFDDVHIYICLLFNRSKFSKSMFANSLRSSGVKVQIPSPTQVGQIPDTQSYPGRSRARYPVLPR